jgi:hypothetical protein
VDPPVTSRCGPRRHSREIVLLPTP